MREGSVRIVGFAGSARTASFNKQLVGASLEACRQSGAEVTRVDLRDYVMPLYDGDLEASEGLPENAARLRALLKEHDGVVVASPEYNGCIPALLKNTLDWVSRSPEASPDLSPYTGKVAAILSASPGALGGMRALGGVRELLTNLGVNVLANQVSLRAAHQEFAADGSLSNESSQKKVNRQAQELVQILAGGTI